MTRSIVTTTLMVLTIVLELVNSAPSIEPIHPIEPIYPIEPIEPAKGSHHRSHHSPISVRNAFLLPAKNKIDGSHVCPAFIHFLHHFTQRKLTIARPVLFQPVHADLLKIKFCLLTRNNPGDYQVIDPTVPSVGSSNYRRGKPVKIIIHGWSENFNLESYRNMSSAFLRREDVNVIGVNWKRGALPFIGQAASNTRVVADAVVDFLRFLMRSFDLKTQDMHIIGFAVGTQAAAFVGKQIKNIRRITALEPIVLYSENLPPEVRLTPSDALFVDVVHTVGHKPVLAGGFSYHRPLGHIDFYPNGGPESQPGCKGQSLIDLVADDKDVYDIVRHYATCSHSRATAYFTESIETPCSCVGVVCDSPASFNEGKCFECGQHGENCVPFGYPSEQWYHSVSQHVPLQPMQVYFYTADSYPFCANHLRFTVQIGSEFSGVQSGKFFAKIKTVEGTSHIPLGRKVIDFGPGSTHRYIVSTRKQHPVTELEMEWLPFVSEDPLTQINKGGPSVTAVRVEGLETVYTCDFEMKFESEGLHVTSDDSCQEPGYSVDGYNHTEMDNVCHPEKLSEVDTPPPLLPVPLFEKPQSAFHTFIDPLLVKLFNRLDLFKVDIPLGT